MWDDIFVMVDNLVYFLEGKTYINLTNACTNKCLFCIRDLKEDVVGANLWLQADNVEAEDVIAQLEAKRESIKDEIIFCGYGEPFLKLEVLKEVAKYIKENFEGTKIRVNTNGHASFVYKRNVPEELKGLVDEVSISLNAADENLYNELSRPSIEDAYLHMQEFARQCVEAGIKTTMTAVTGFRDYDVDTDACQRLCKDIGAQFRAREWIEQGY